MSDEWSNGDDVLGRGYWAGFMARNGREVESKRGEKFAADRDNWSTYRNFDSMYKHCYEEMVHAGVAVKLEQPVWMDKHGVECEENEAYGRKVTHVITHPEYCVVGDEVGGNTNQKGDGHIGGEKVLVERGVTAKKKVSTKDCHFTVMGLTALNGQPVMCILILKGLRVDTGVEIGLDEFARVIGERGDKDFVLKNSGAGNMFPGGPTCRFRGKDVPCFVRWSEKGSMTSSILRDILADLDQRGLFPRSDNPHLRPFALFDGHGSRIEFEFLNYINDAGHQWVVCIGVPYGTATWQVGDSKEQNGSFNIALARAKINLVKKKAEHCLPAVINRTDIVVILNEAWKHSFGRVEKNRKAIADRGWNPLNRNILCLKEVIGAMTDEDKEKDELVPYKQKGTKIHDNSKPEYDAMYLPGSTPNIISLDKVNMDDGIASQVVQDIVQHAELMNVREMIAKKKQEGSIIADRLKAVKKLTAGQIFTSGTTRLGKDVFQALQEKINKKDEEVRKKNNDKKKECEQARAKVQEIRQKRKEPSDLNNKELTTMLKYKRRKTDRKLPTKKQDMLSLYHHWYTEGQPFFRPSPVCSPNVSDAESDMEMSVVDNNDVDIVIPIEKV